MVKLYMQRAKDRYIARELALLRASKPTPPMVSHLDEVDENTIEEGIRRVMEAISQAAPPAATAAAVPPCSSEGPCDQTSPSAQPPSASEAACDQTSPSARPPPASEAACDQNSPDVWPPSPSATEHPFDRSSPGMQPPSANEAATTRKKQKRGPRTFVRTPAPGCHRCKVLFTELNVVKKLLECEVERNHELKQLHSSTKRDNVSTMFFF